MRSSSHRFIYLGFFKLNDNLGKDFEQPQRTIEEQLIDNAETAQFNSELVRTGCFDDSSSLTEEVELRLSDALQFFHPNSSIPFERIPLHKVKHIVSFENGRGALNVLLVESYAYSSDHRLGFVNKCHLFETQRDDNGTGRAMVQEFCQGFKQKFEEILAKYAEQQQK